MKAPIPSPTTNKTTNKKHNPNPITKYFIQNNPTSTKKYSRTQSLINKIKNTATKTILNLKKSPQNLPKITNSYHTTKYLPS